MRSNGQSEIAGHGVTHVGNVREDNQDAIRFGPMDEHLIIRHGHLYGVADGMGGYAEGGVASTVALDTFFDIFYKSDGVPVKRKLRECVQAANLGVVQTAKERGIPRMGTTLTAVNVTGRTLHVAHVGDSRAYLIRRGKATCLTNDHTRVGEMVRMKMLSPDKLCTHSQRSVLSKSLGLELFVQPDIFKVPVHEGDVIILCTDGVWSVIEDSEFAGIASERQEPDHLARQILEVAMQRGSDDNVSVIALSLRKLADHPGEQRESRWGKFFRRLSRDDDDLLEDNRRIKNSGEST